MATRSKMVLQMEIPAVVYLFKDDDGVNICVNDSVIGWISHSGTLVLLGDIVGSGMQLDKFGYVKVVKEVAE